MLSRYHFGWSSSSYLGSWGNLRKEAACCGGGGGRWVSRSTMRPWSHCFILGQPPSTFYIVEKLAFILYKPLYIYFLLNKLNLILTDSVPTHYISGSKVYCNYNGEGKKRNRTISFITLEQKISSHNFHSQILSDNFQPWERKKRNEGEVKMEKTLLPLLCHFLPALLLLGKSYHTSRPREMVSVWLLTSECIPPLPFENHISSNIFCLTSSLLHCISFSTCRLHNLVGPMPYFFASSTVTRKLSLCGRTQ